MACDPNEFAGRRAVVTGGTKGTGRAVVRRLVSGGARVVTVARSVADEQMGDVTLVRADLATEAGCTTLAEAALDRLGGIDLIVTDPPYLTRYRDRTGRTVINDDQADWLAPAFAQMHRVLKRDAFCISFYGWPKADLFIQAWRKAGFRLGGHLVFRKRYGSRSAFLQYRHEMAYLLIRGAPCYPGTALPDVLDWTYTRTRW